MGTTTSTGITTAAATIGVRLMALARPSELGSSPSRPMENSTRVSAVVEAIAHAKNDVAMLASSTIPTHEIPYAVASSFTGDALDVMSRPSDSKPTSWL